MKRNTKIIFFDIIIIISSFSLITILLNINMPACYIKKFAGIDCPTCGGTRMVLSLLKFQPINAFFYNPFLFLVLIYGCLFFLLVNISIFNKKAIQLIKKLYCLKMCYVWCAGLIIFSILRMLKLL